MLLFNWKYKKNWLSGKTLSSTGTAVPKHYLRRLSANLEKLESRKKYRRYLVEMKSRFNFIYVFYEMYLSRTWLSRSAAVSRAECLWWWRAGAAGGRVRTCGAPSGRRWAGREAPPPAHPAGTRIPAILQKEGRNKGGQQQNKCCRSGMFIPDQKIFPSRI